MKTNLKLWSLTAAMAGLLFGFDTIVISGAEQELQELWKSYTLFGQNKLFHGWVVVASALFGTVIGSILGGFPTDRLGRKKTLLVIGVLYSISALGSALVNDPWSFAIFRFIGGLGVGASTIAAPAFISEIAPAAKRGRLVALYQLNIVIGILIGFISNLIIGAVVEIQEWRWMIGVEVFPAIVYTFLVIKVPESPRWLISKKGDTMSARKILSTIYNSAETSAQIAAIQKHQTDNVKKEFLLQPKFKVPVLLAFAVSFFNQFSGINAVLYYSVRIFEQAGLGQEAGLLSSVGLGIANLIFTILGVALIDRIGRKKLMYLGSVGYIVTLTTTALSFMFGWTSVVPVALFLFIGSHAIGQGAIIWVFISEIFPNNIRAAGQSFGNSVHWVLAAIIPAMVPFLMDVNVFGPTNVFGIFAGFMVLQLVWVVFIMPETKGVSLEELQDKLTK